MGEILMYDTENPGNIRERLLMYEKFVKKREKEKADEAKKSSKDKED